MNIVTQNITQIHFPLDRKMSVPSTSPQTDREARESGAPFKESTRYSIIPYTGLQNVEYNRARTYITQTDLEICISGSLFCFKNAEMTKMIQNHPKSLPVQCILN